MIKAVISSPASQALAGPIFLSNDGHLKKLLMIINFNFLLLLLNKILIINSHAMMQTRGYNGSDSAAF